MQMAQTSFAGVGGGGAIFSCREQSRVSPVVTWEYAAVPYTHFRIRIAHRSKRTTPTLRITWLAYLTAELHQRLVQIPWLRTISWQAVDKSLGR